jgi:hypothetical protein
VIGSRARKGAPAISTASALAVLAALALVGCAAAWLASRSGGLVRILAQLAAVVFASLAGAFLGLLIPLAPLVREAIGEAFWAGLLATLGTIAGMSLAETLMAKLDRIP